MRRVVVTGIGVVSPLGSDWPSTWAALVAGRSGVGPLTRFDAAAYPARIAGEATAFDPAAHFDARDLHRTDRFVQLARVAAREAVADAGLVVDDALAERVGVYVGSGVGGLDTLCDATLRVDGDGPRKVSAYTVPKLIINLAAGRIAMDLGARGPALAMVSACASGNHNLGEAARAIAGGWIDVAIAGGAEAPLTPLALAAFARMKALSTRNDDPAAASRPFDAGRDGFVVAEGAGLLVLEARSTARRRGAPILAELAGYGLTADAYHETLPSPDGDGARRCIVQALADAQAAPDDVGYVNAHGTSTRINDAVETRALHDAFGDHARRLAVSSTKSCTGHLLGAAGGVEAAVCVQALRDGVLPPTINYAEMDPACDLDYVPNVARERRVDVALSNAFGFGGTNACLVFRRGQG